MNILVDGTQTRNTRRLVIHRPVTRDEFVWLSETTPSEVYDLLAWAVAEGWQACRTDQGRALHLMHPQHTGCEGEA